MPTLQLQTPPKNHKHHLVPGRQDTRPQPCMSREIKRTTGQNPAASSPMGQTNGTTGPVGQIAELPAGAYVWVRHKSRRDRRNTLGRRGHFDGDIEMQAPRHIRESLLDEEREHHSQNQSQSQSHYRHHERHRHRYPYPYLIDGAGMGYDDEDGKEAGIEVGTARVAHFKLVPAGAVSIRNIGWSKGSPLSLMSSGSVRDVVSLPDLAWAETLTTGGGRRPGIAPAAPAAPLPSPPLLAPSTTRTSSTETCSSSSRNGGPREPSRKLQERSESRRAVKKKAIKEWCARGSGGSLGPYAGAY
ncbi:hypothetical protein diail_12150 [Diaporthe ilicicola]|nr:hypothetical protein diail_12150 [Diaporthe ilicicola]